MDTILFVFRSQTYKSLEAEKATAEEMLQTCRGRGAFI